MIIALPFCPADAERAERLLDAIYWLGKGDHCLICPSSNVSAEHKERVKLAAGIAFKSVDMIEPKITDGAPKVQQINQTFQHVSKFIWQTYRDAWLWLEPSCVPLKRTWLADLATGYESQPRRYLGAHMQQKAGLFLSRVAIYPPDCWSDFNEACQGVNPFHRVAKVANASTSSWLFKIAEWQEGMDLGDAVLLDGDKSGKLIETIIESTGQKRLVKIPDGEKIAA